MKNPVQAAKFMLPKSAFPLSKWAVIACDQHTSDIDYWRQLKAWVGDAPSTLNLIFPETYLAKETDTEKDKRIDAIHSSMRTLLNDNILDTHEGMVYIERRVTGGKVRKGILLCIDLEDYSFKRGTATLVRASESTVLERLPPRIAVREKALLELSHTMLLYEDPNFIVEKAVAASANSPLYHFDLNSGGGSICGRLIAQTENVVHAFKQLSNTSESQYDDPFLFAVGDGNHSLAAAKKLYEQAKAQGDAAHCRYALCEAVNIYDNALQFEPIHRYIFIPKDDEVHRQEISALLQNMPTDPIEAVAYVDALAAKYNLEVDYIHGADHLKKLTKEQNGLPILLKPITKDGFFPYIAKNGALPKKTFSMGEAEDKRYYLEVAAIKN